MSVQSKVRDDIEVLTTSVWWDKRAVLLTRRFKESLCPWRRGGSPLYNADKPPVSGEHGTGARVFIRCLLSYRNYQISSATMPLTPAQKQKRYREKLKQNSEKHEEAKKKHRELYHKTKRLVKDLTPKEKKHANLIWKLRQREYRKKQKNLQTVLAATPPSTPVSELLELNAEINQTPPPSPQLAPPKERGRKKVKRNRSKLYRQNKKLKEDLELLKKKCEKYRKRSVRNKNPNKEDDNDNIRQSIDARETCLCKIHANIYYKAQALKRQGIIKTDNLSEIVKATVCNDHSQSCMYNDCSLCKFKKLEYNQEKITGTIKSSEWIRKEESYEKEGKKVKCFKNVKEETVKDSVQFLQTFEKDMISFKKHVYNIKIQFHNFRECLSKLQPNECAIVVDFSENFNCKYHEEIQSHHFGGSRKQVSLHTVMVYIFNPDTKYTAHSFCTISSSNCHQPAAIWAHLEPIMQWIRKEYTLVDTIHFFSDGPSTQYRQKQNFYLLCTRYFDFGFAAVTWSFFEAGHGKGPADGIGGFLKRTADKIIATGHDISNADQFFEKLKHTSKIKLFLIEEQCIKDIQDSLPRTIPRLIGTLKVHQIFTENRNTLKYRNLSCFCGLGKNGFCDCLNPQIYSTSVMEPTRIHDSSDDDMPLSSHAVLKEVQNTMPRSSVYKTIYGSSDTDGEEMPAVRSNKENTREMISSTTLLNETDNPQASTSSDRIAIGDFLHVNVYTDDSRKKKYSYVCKALTPVEEDGEVKVMFLRVIGKKDAKIFRLDEQDISYVDYQDVIEILPAPAVVIKGRRIYHHFRKSISIFEK
ncbi:hypothetical protein MSG28_005977 [Choristoneura fumiferana]|uniref:Uncharacterized protein n=1 Tax=Choristoneura fumiferana TaxID=7141 RepID=A0ACC0L1J7_CHOFU|nr:hypothetical protein MSG28_005977 [Choristoneura fumiferana]